jgi:16S rRNA (cytidine1402-2'-O)-methyltransferase
MLFLIATPIGDPDDITVRALKCLTEADVIICEGTKETSKLLKHHQIKARQFEVLNEHTKPEELEALVKLCKSQNVALVTDCGTPGFCDPGADLVRLCHQQKIPYTSLLGPSALMGIISLSGTRLDQFLFRGFLPAENEARARAWGGLKKIKASQGFPVILLDTPYRLKKTLSELQHHFPERECTLVLNLSQSNETVLKGTPEKIAKTLLFEKAEFMVLIN